MTYPINMLVLSKHSQSLVTIDACKHSRLQVGKFAVLTGVFRYVQLRAYFLETLSRSLSKGRIEKALVDPVESVVIDEDIIIIPGRASASPRERTVTVYTPLFKSGDCGQIPLLRQRDMLATRR